MASLLPNRFLRVQLHDNAATLPEVSGGAAGGDISAWKDHRAELVKVVVEKQSGTGTLTLTNPELIAYDPITAEWYSVGALNGGAVISVTDNKNFAQLLTLDSASYSRLAVQATVGGTSPQIDVFAEPVTRLES